MRSRCKLLISLLLFLFLFTWNAAAQQDQAMVLQDSMAVQDTARIASMMTVAKPEDLAKAFKPFKPNPTRAVLYSAILPGLGQIYNRKYWKLPIVYGGFVGCTYAITWNNRNYTDYSNAFSDIVSGDPNRNSWENFIPAGQTPETVDKDWLQSSLKRKKDFFRRNRDLSIICTVGLYVLCMIDAYVDAQLFDFDVSPDLSMRVEPYMNDYSKTSTREVGVNCSIKF